MGGTVIRFPLRRASCVWVLREAPAWLVVFGEHGWLFPSRQAAMAEARSLARQLSTNIREAAQ